MSQTIRAVDRLFWRLGILDPASPVRVNLPILAGIVSFHSLALLAVIPWLFSWSALAGAVVGLYIFGTWGMTIGYHRLLTHRGFACPPWFEHMLSLIGACCWQGTPMAWVSAHRMHHQHSDEPSDPHSPRSGFFWSHMGWFMINDPVIFNITTYDRYARDLMMVRFYKNLERPRIWRTVHAGQWALFFGIGAIIGAVESGTLMGSLQMALSWLIWGVFVRMVAVWHITWSVNSFTHIWGYRNFNTADDSKNNWVVAFFSNGEGWHNNHHAEPRCAAHGRRWWELDITYVTIRTFALFGLAWDIVTPRRSQLDPHEQPRHAA